MMLKGQKSQIRIRCVAVIQEDAGSKPQRIPFHAVFKKMMSDERKRVLQNIQNAETDDDALISEYLVSWSELLDADNEDVEFSEQAVHDVMQVPEYQEALVNGFIESMTGHKVKEKN